MSKQRGRPRTHQDFGTPELIAKRQAVVGEGAPEMSEYPLGIMLALGIISQDQHNVGVRYSALYRKSVGRRVTVRSIASPSAGEPDEDPKQDEIEYAWRRCKTALLGCGRRACDAFENAAIFHRFPYWLQRELGSVHVVRHSEIAERKAILTALDALVDVLQGAQRPPVARAA